jgi:hypothetical protein
MDDIAAEEYIAELEAITAYAAKMLNEHCGCLNGRYFTVLNIKAEWENSLSTGGTQ